MPAKNHGVTLHRKPALYIRSTPEDGLIPDLGTDHVRKKSKRKGRNRGLSKRRPNGSMTSKLSANRKANRKAKKARANQRRLA